MWKIDPKINIYTKISYTNSYVEHVCNSDTTLWHLGEEGKEKRMLVNDIKMHYICASKGHNDMY
jgi:hypothetical protein